jgi:hypothetical protein
MISNAYTCSDTTNKVFMWKFSFDLPTEESLRPKVRRAQRKWRELESSWVRELESRRQDGRRDLASVGMFSTIFIHCFRCAVSLK